MERLKRQLRQRFDAEEAELILEQESDALSLAVDVQTFEVTDGAKIGASLEVPCPRSSTPPSAQADPPPPRRCPTTHTTRDENSHYPF